MGSKGKSHHRGLSKFIDLTDCSPEKYDAEPVADCGKRELVIEKPREVNPRLIANSAPFINTRRVIL